MTVIDEYLEDLRGHLAVDMLTEREILREVRAHLEEVVAEEMARGRQGYYTTFSAEGGAKVSRRGRLAGTTSVLSKCIA